MEQENGRRLRQPQAGRAAPGGLIIALGVLVTVLAVQCVIDGPQHVWTRIAESFQMMVSPEGFPDKEVLRQGVCYYDITSIWGSRTDPDSDDPRL